MSTEFRAEGFVNNRCVAGTDFLAALNLPIETWQFGKEDGGLEGVETAVHADVGVVVTL